MAKLGIGGMSHRSFHGKSAILLTILLHKKAYQADWWPIPFSGFFENRSWSRRLQGDVRWTTIGQPSGGQRTWVWWTLPFQSDGNRSGSASLGDGLDGSASHKSEPEPFCFDIALTNQLPCFATAEICSPSQKVWDWYWYSYHFILSLFWHQW